MSKKHSRRAFLAIFVLIAAAAIGAAYFIKTNQKTSTATFNPQSPSTAKGEGADKQSGGVVDNSQAKSGSQASTPPSSAAGLTSASGVITLNAPLAGATIGNGTSVSGTANGLSLVQYRIENANGLQLAQGQLSVVNGAFSGTISGLQVSGSSGTFEVYDYKNGNGPEENDAKVSVEFK